MRTATFLGYFRSLPLRVRQPILILSPFVGDPRERRDDIALPPSFGPPRRRGGAANSDFVPLCLGTPENAGVT